MERQEFQWNCKRKQSEPLRELYPKHFHDTLSQFCFNGVLIERCQLLWLLHSGKVVVYKVEIPIPVNWILTEGELLASESCRSN